MKVAALHPHEAARQSALEQLHLTGDEYEESFDRLTRLIRYVLGVKTSTFSVVDGCRQFFKSVQGLDVRETPRDVAFCAHAILQDEMLIVPDALLDERFKDNPLVTGEPRIRFYAGIAIRAHNGMPIGTLCAIDDHPRQLMPEQRALLEDLRDILEETLLLRSLSVKDHLTGLFNRRYFDEFFEREWRRGYRTVLPLSVLLIDVDHFKPYNDTLGHQAGDATLRKVARHLTQQLRRGGDIAARYGGEEFVMVLPETSLADAEQVAAKLCASIQQLGIEHPSSPERVITVSIGGACISDSEGYLLGHTALVARADAALYEAKQAGRNRVQMR
ncbi:MAG: sensor domain-containing diguanylate cyclase [Pseudomonadota bacterium]